MYGIPDWASEMWYQASYPQSVVVRDRWASTSMLCVVYVWYNTTSHHFPLHFQPLWGVLHDLMIEIVMKDGRKSGRTQHGGTGNVYWRRDGGHQRHQSVHLGLSCGGAACAWAGFGGQDSVVSPGAPECAPWEHQAPRSGFMMGAWQGRLEEGLSVVFMKPVDRYSLTLWEGSLAKELGICFNVVGAKRGHGWMRGRAEVRLAVSSRLLKPKGPPWCNTSFSLLSYIFDIFHDLKDAARSFALMEKMWMRAEYWFPCPVCVAVNKGSRLGVQHRGWGRGSILSESLGGVSVCLAGPWVCARCPARGWSGTRVPEGKG